MHASLRSQISVNFTFEDIIDVTGSANAAVYVDTPVLAADATPMRNVDAHCRPISPSNGNRKELLEILTSVIHLNFSSAWGFGYEMAAKVSNPKKRRRKEENRREYELTA